MTSRKKSVHPARKAKRAAVEAAYPFELQPDRDYRLTFRNGQSAIYHGAALASNPHVPLAEILQVHDESTGKRVYQVE